jgi:hypothetical protein
MSAPTVLRLAGPGVCSYTEPEGTAIDQKKKARTKLTANVDIPGQRGF